MKRKMKCQDGDQGDIHPVWTHSGRPRYVVGDISREKNTHLVWTRTGRPRNVVGDVFEKREKGPLWLPRMEKVPLRPMNA